MPRMTHEQDAAMRAATELIYAERYRQHAEHGEQNLPLARYFRDWHELEASGWRAANETLERLNLHSFFSLSMEEVNEACAEVDLDRQIEEWTQFAAVAHQGLECLLRRKAVAE
ncbi:MULTISPECIES: hypothetical protein [unclassified Luteococcus]|uniref:hypothetical protein n=1 Tax=unclassified Luteococcus TaxID=2639923 RepID=UPI00313DE482